jgi:predicted nucleic acid-binding protein
MHAFALAVLLTAAADKPATLDEKIAAALKSHPDVKAAEAKKLLAEAELEQARLAITQKVSAAVSRVELAKAKLMQAEEEATIAAKVMKFGATELEKAKLMQARPALIAAKAELAAAELELQQLIGAGVKVEAKPADKSEQPTAMLPTGPAMEKLEAAVLMTVKLDFKEMEPKKAFEGLLSAVRVDPASVRGLKLFAPLGAKVPKLDLVGEQTFAGWVQLLLDEFNTNNGLVGQGGGFGGGGRLVTPKENKLGVYVREYGLMIEFVENAPKDAITLTEFSRAVRAKQK